MPRRKVFISYHRADLNEVRGFLDHFGRFDTFIHRAVATMPEDVINSTNPDYIMSRVRQDYLQDSTVTLVLIGRCTWARKFVDWEIQSSLRQGDTVTPNGLLGVVLPSVNQNPRAPNRLAINLAAPPAESYARWYYAPANPETLAGWIEDAFVARTEKRHLIKNPRERMVNNLACQ